MSSLAFLEVIWQKKYGENNFLMILSWKGFLEIQDIYYYVSRPLWSEVYVAQLCLTLCNPMDYIPPSSSLHGILHGILECFAILFSRNYPHPGIQSRSPSLQTDSLPSRFHNTQYNTARLWSIIWLLRSISYSPSPKCYTSWKKGNKILFKNGIILGKHKNSYSQTET